MHWAKKGETILRGEEKGRQRKVSKDEVFVEYRLLLGLITFS